MTPSEIGAVAEREVACALARSGHGVYLPMLMPHSRVDLVAEIGQRLVRVQVKSARLVGEVINFRSCSNTGNLPRAYRGEVDAFGVYCPELGTSYLVPIDDVPDRTCSLRLAPPLNGQQRGIRWAGDYLIDSNGPRLSM